MKRKINGRYYKLVDGECDKCCFANIIDYTQCLYASEKTFSLLECFDRRKVWKKSNNILPEITMECIHWALWQN